MGFLDVLGRYVVLGEQFALRDMSVLVDDADTSSVLTLGVPEHPDGIWASHALLQELGVILQLRQDVALRCNVIVAWELLSQAMKVGH